MDYAPPFDAETFEAEMRERMRSGPWLFSGLIVLIISILLLAGIQGYLAQGLSTLVVIYLIVIIIFSLIITFVVRWGMKKISEMPKKIIKAGGWYIMEDFPKHFSLSAKYGIVMGLVSFFISYTLYGLTLQLTTLVFFGYGFSSLLISRVWPLWAARGFELPFDQTCLLLETSTTQLIPGGTWKTNMFGWRVLAGEGEKVKINRGQGKQKDKTGVTVSTPRGQEERNRQLREAVAAVLEGRSPVSGRAAGPAAEGRA